MAQVNETLKPRSGTSILLTYVGEKFGDAWMWMLALGVVHHHVRSVPAFGYWLTLLLVWLLVGSSSLHTPTHNALFTKRTVSR